MIIVFWYPATAWFRFILTVTQVFLSSTYSLRYYDVNSVRSVCRETSLFRDWDLTTVVFSLEEYFAVCVSRSSLFTTDLIRLDYFHHCKSLVALFICTRAIKSVWSDRRERNPRQRPYLTSCSSWYVSWYALRAARVWQRPPLESDFSLSSLLQHLQNLLSSVNKNCLLSENWKYVCTSVRSNLIEAFFNSSAYASTENLWTDNTYVRDFYFESGTSHDFKFVDALNLDRLWRLSCKETFFKKKNWKFKGIHWSALFLRIFKIDFREKCPDCWICNTLISW